MRLFVTGGAGFIGSNFIRNIVTTRGGWELVNFDALTYAGNLQNLHDVSGDPGYTFVRGNICDSDAVQRSMIGCDAVVHFAAESHVDRSIYDPGPFIDTNVRGTAVLLNVARSLGIKRFVHVSTDEVYGDIDPGVFACEDHRIAPSSPYSASKASSDFLVLSYVRTYGLPAIVTRASNNYGPYQFPEKFLPLMISNAMEGRKLPVYGDGLQQRDWLHVEDHCRAILAVLENGRVGSVYNIGGANVLTNLDVVRRIISVLGASESLVEHVIDRPGHDRRYALDCRKIEREVGWRPNIAFEDGLIQTVRWYQEQSEWVAQVKAGEYQSYYERYYTNRERALAFSAAQATGGSR